MKVWAVANQKGGVGKTTTAVSLAGLLERRRCPTLLIDLDPHGSLTAYFGYDPDNIECSGFDIFQAAAQGMQRPLAASLCRTRYAHLSLLPAATALVSLDRQFGAKAGMGLVIRRTLARFGERFAHVIIDCPSMLGVLLVNALAACDLVVIPVQTEYLALKGLERINRTFEMIGRAQELAFGKVIVPTMFDRRTRAAHESLGWLQRNYPADLWNGTVPVDTKFREASQAGVPLPLSHPGSRGAMAYEQLLQHLLQGDTPMSKLGLAV